MDESPKPLKDPRRQGRLRWGPAKAKLFLDELSEHCNVVRAAQNSGFCKRTVYNKRREDPEFAARWDEAVARGWERVDAALLSHALDYAERGGLEAELARRPMTVKDCIALLNRNALKAQSQRTAARAANVDAARASILKKTAAMRRAAARES